MALDSSTWQRSRLIPVTAITGQDEQERRATSAFLAVLKSVKEFGRAVTQRCGAPSGVIETFIEVPFKVGEGTCRPDGVITVSRGQRHWAALVEVKTGRAQLGADQVSTYIDVAREQGFDAVVTVSNEITTTPGVHPLAIDSRKLRRVTLHHLSWSRIHTEALIEQFNRTVADPDQAWILSEFIRYLEYPKSGTFDFDDMGEHWASVRDATSMRTLRPNAKETVAVVSRFDQLVSFAGMMLSRSLGVHVRQGLSKGDLVDSDARVRRQAQRLVDVGELSGHLVVPNAAAPLEVLVDLRAGRVDISTTIDCPTNGRPTTRVNWLIRQLKDPPEPLLVKPVVARSRRTFASHDWRKLAEEPSRILEVGADDIRAFTITMSRSAGSKRGQGRGSFVESVLGAVDKFYGEVLQNLKPWVAAAPKTQDGEPQVVVPSTDVSGRQDTERVTTTEIVAVSLREPDEVGPYGA